MTDPPSVPVASGPNGLRTPETTRYQGSTELGRGGLGRVMLARDHRLGREVAIKQLSAPSPTNRARFVREVQLTAQLEHPGIVPIYDAGVDEQGEPYYAMRRVSGETLTERVAATTDAADRLTLVPLVLAAAEAVAFAHERGVVHRDLKPSNILIGARGETIVIDWGLARRTTEIRPAPSARAGATMTDRVGSGDATTSAVADGATQVTSDESPITPALDSDQIVTTDGEVVGTPAFMPPEQALGDVVDARADVYALGATLYHALAGAAPYVGSARTVLTLVVAGAPTPLADRAPGTPPELVAIVERAMARAPADRYQDAGALVADLRRFLTGRLVGAHQYRPWSLVRWWLRRHRTVALVIAGAAALLAAIGVASVLGIRDERRVARHERDLADRSANRLRLLQARAELERDPTTAAAWLASYRIEPDQVAEVIRVASAAAPAVATDLFTLAQSTVLRVCTAPDGARVLGVDRAGDVHLWDRTGGATAGVRVGTIGESPTSCRFSASGHAAIVLGRRGTLGVVDVRTRVWTRSALAPMRRAAWAGDQLVVAGKDNHLYVTDAAGATPRDLGPTPYAIVWMTSTPDGTGVAFTGLDGTTTVWPLTGAPRHLEKHARPPSSLALGADGTVVTGAADGVKLHAADGRTRTLALAQGNDAVVMVSAIPGGALYTETQTQKLWRWSGDGSAELVASDVVYDSLSASADGSRAVWASQDGIVHLLDTASGAIRDLRGHASGVRDLALSRNGRTIVSAAEDATIRVWEPPAPDGAPLLGAAGAITHADSSAAGHLVVGDTTGQVTRWEAGVARVVGRLDGPLEGLAVSDDGARVAAARVGGPVTVWLADGVARIRTAPTSVTPIGFAADGALLAMGDDRKLRAWDDAGAERLLLQAKAPFTGGVVTSDGRWVLVSAFDGLRLVEVATAVETPLTGPDVTSFRITASPDARTVAAGTGAGAVWVWTVGGDGAGRRVGQLRGTITELAFAPDGATLAAADETGAIALLPVAGGEPRWLHGHDARVSRLGFTAAGRLVSVDRRGLLRAWDPATGASAVIGEHRGKVRHLMFAGETVTAVDERAAPRVWHLDRAALTPADPRGLETWVAALTRARIDDATGAAATRPAAPAR